MPCSHLLPPSCGFVHFLRGPGARGRPRHPKCTPRAGEDQPSCLLGSSREASTQEVPGVSPGTTAPLTARHPQCKNVGQTATSPEVSRLPEHKLCHPGRTGTAPEGTAALRGSRGTRSEKRITKSPSGFSPSTAGVGPPSLGGSDRPLEIEREACFGGDGAVRAGREGETEMRASARGPDAACLSSLQIRPRSLSPRPWK